MFLGYLVTYSSASASQKCDIFIPGTDFTLPRDRAELKKMEEICQSSLLK